MNSEDLFVAGWPDLEGEREGGVGWGRGWVCVCVGRGGVKPYRHKLVGMSCLFVGCLLEVPAT